MIVALLSNFKGLFKVTNDKQKVKKDRKQDILQSLAQMLEEDLSERITTARLAKHVGVSEAALYRHFPSKARMYGHCWISQKKVCLR